MYKISASGREITLYRIHSGECCPLMTSSILGETEYEASACVTTGLVLLIPVDIFVIGWIDIEISASLSLNHTPNEF